MFILWYSTSFGAPPFDIVAVHRGYIKTIDVLNKDCRRSISAILTWVPENVKISARPLNSIGN